MSLYRPSTSTAVRARRPEAAHTSFRSVTNAVFHLLMSALNAGPADRNACEPTGQRSTAAHGARKRCGRVCAHTCTHVDIRMDQEICIPNEYICYGCVCA